MKHRILVLAMIGSLAVPGVVSLQGCAGKMGAAGKSDENALVIPDFPTAKDQFQFARMYQNSQLIAPELDRRRLQMSKIGECYQRVITNFPNDTTYVPLTYLELGDCAAQSDEFERALGYYQQADSSSDDDFVSARAQYSIARIYDTLQRFEEAKAIYKSIMEQYGRSESGKVIDVVKRAAQLYYKVQDTSAERQASK